MQNNNLISTKKFFINLGFKRKKGKYPLKLGVMEDQEKNIFAKREKKKATASKNRSSSNMITDGRWNKFLDFRSTLQIISCKLICFTMKLCRQKQLTFFSNVPF